MRLLEDGENGVPTHHSFNLALNGNNDHSDEYETSDSESDMEEVEPVSATLVLRLVSEPPSPSVSRKTSFRRDQPPAFINGDDRGETFLQVQVQRSSSSSGSRPQPTPRPPTATPSLCLTDAEGFNSYKSRRSRLNSGDTSRECSPDMLGLQEMDLQRDEGVGVDIADFMQKVSEQTKVIQQGLKTLRGEVDNPLRVLDIGQEAIVLSGLNRQAGESLKNIKNLYDETKYLKSYLEKLEANVQYEMEGQNKTTNRSSWYSRLLYISLFVCAGGFAWRKHDQAGFERNISLLGAAAASAFTKSRTIFKS